MNHFKKIPHMLAVAILCGILIFTGVYLVTSPAPKATAANTPAAVTLTPAEATNPIKTQHTLTATVIDATGDPVAGTEVEWILNRFPAAVGDIVQVSNGDKVDNFYAMSTTNSAGQATVTITATRPGDTDVTAFVPAITDATKHKAFAVKHWVDVDVDWPGDDVNKIGTDHPMTVMVFKATDGTPLAGIDITWTITDDNPNARFQGLSTAINTTASVTDAAGEATITLQQVIAVAGENTVHIEVSQAGILLFQHDAVKKWLSPSLDISKTGPTTAEIGSTVTFTIAVTNDGDESANGVTVVDQIPNGLSYLDSTAAGVVAGKTVTWNLGNMAVGSISRITVTFTATQKGTWTNRATATSTEGALATATADIQVTGEAILDITKTGTASLEQGEQATYTITVTNNGVAPAANTVITDTIPVGLSYASSVPAGTVSGQTVTWNVGTLAVGASTTVTLTVNADTVGNFINAAVATATDTASVTDTADTEVLAPPPPLVPDVSITKTGIATPLYINQNGDFTITVTNNGETELTNVVVTDTIPTVLTYVSASPAGTVAGKTVTWNVGTLAVGASRTLTLRCMGNALGNFTNTASVATAEGVSGMATAAGIVTAKSGVTMQITDTVDPLPIGNTTTYEITVTNQGLIAVHNAGLSVYLPDSVSYVTSTGPSAATVVGRTVTFAPLVSFNTGITVTFTVTVTGVAPGDVLCRATLTYDEFDLPIASEEGTTIYTP